MFPYPYKHLKTFKSKKQILIPIVVDVDRCYENKCAYGYCHPTEHGYECQCKDGYKGEYCQGS